MIQNTTTPRNRNSAERRIKNISTKIWNKLDTPLPAIIPGADAGMLILTTIGSVLAYTGAMILLIHEIAAGFVGIITNNPNFEFEIVNSVETGNFSFLMFSILRDVSVYFFVLMFLIFGILLALRQAQLVTSDTLKNMVKSASIGIIIIMIFPYLWDPISDTSTMSALWILNPLYSFDDDAPCITSADPRVVQLTNYQRIMKEKSLVGGIIQDSNSICSPDLRPDYLFSKAIFGASFDLEFESEGEEEWWNVLDHINAYVTTISQGIFGIMFEGITKTTILFFLASMAALVGSMRHLLTDVIAIGLPIFLVLRCLPFWGIEKMANMLLSVFVPLLFVPFFTALIISAGSASLLTQELDVGLIDSSDDLSSLATDRYLFWMYSIATLSLAVMTPVMFVPMLGSVANMMGKMVMTGTMTGVMGAAGAAQGMMKGGTSAFSGLAAGAGIGKMGALRSMFTSPNSLGTVIGGMGSGGMSAVRGAFQNDMGGAGRIIPGAGSIPSFSSSSNPAGGESSTAYANAYQKGQFIASEGQIVPSHTMESLNHTGKPEPGLPLITGNLGVIGIPAPAGRPAPRITPSVTGNHGTITDTNPHDSHQTGQYRVLPSVTGNHGTITDTNPHDSHQTGQYRVLPSVTGNKGVLKDTNPVNKYLIGRNVENDESGYIILDTDHNEPTLTEKGRGVPLPHRQGKEPK